MRWLLLIFILSFGIANSQETKKTPDPKAHAAEKDKGGKIVEKSTPPQTVNIIASGNIGLVAEPPKNAGQNPNGEGHSNIKLILDAVLAVATVGLFIATLLLYLATRGLVTEARNQLPHFIENVNSSKGATKAAQEAAVAATQQTILAQSTYLAVHRPRLIVRRVQIRCDETGYGIEFVLANIGDSLAKRISGNINVRITPLNDRKKFERNSIPLYGGEWRAFDNLVDPISGIGPGVQAGGRKPIMWESSKISDESMKPVRQGEAFVHFFGEIRYWNFTDTTEISMGFFRTYELGEFHTKADPDYEWN